MLLIFQVFVVEFPAKLDPPS